MRGEGEKSNTDNIMFSLWTSRPHQSRLQSQEEDFRNPRPGEKASEIVRKKSKNHRRMCLWALLICLLFFKVLSDHDETTEDDVVVDESLEESTGTVPPLPPVSWFKDTRISRHAEMRCGKFRKKKKKKQCNGNDCRDGEESSFFDCWYWRHKQSHILQHADP